MSLHHRPAGEVTVGNAGRGAPCVRYHLVPRPLLTVFGWRMFPDVDILNARTSVHHAAADPVAPSCRCILRQDDVLTVCLIG